MKFFGLSLLFSLLALAASSSKATSVTVSAVAASGFNDLRVDGFTSITSDDFSRGNASTETFWEGDGVEILEYRDAHYSPFFSGSSCGRVEFASNYSTITAFLLTKNKFLEMFHKGSLNYTDYKSESLFYWNNRIKGSYLFNLNTTQNYIVVAINTGGQSKSGSAVKASTTFRMQLGIFGSGSQVCTKAKQPGGWPTSDEVANDNSNIIPYYESSDTLGRGLDNNSIVATVTNLSCLSMQLPANVDGASDLDLTATVIPVSRYLDWLNSQKTNISWIGSAITQSGTANFKQPSLLTVTSSLAVLAGSTLQISKHQTGQVNIDSLEPSMQYVIVVWSGLNGGSMHEPFTDVLLRYGGRTSGTCNSTIFAEADNRFVNWLSKPTEGPGSQPAGSLPQEGLQRALSTRLAFRTPQINASKMQSGPSRPDISTVQSSSFSSKRSQGFVKAS